METRPKLKVKLTLPDVLIAFVGWLALILLWTLVLYNYPHLPDLIPNHYNAYNQVDHYGAKSTLLILPIIATVIFIAMTILNRFPHIFNYPVRITSENAGVQYKNATRMVLYLKFVIPFVFLMIVFQTMQITSGKTPLFGIWLLPLILAIVFIPIAFFLIFAFRNK